MGEGDFNLGRLCWKYHEVPIEQQMHNYMKFIPIDF